MTDLLIKLIPVFPLLAVIANGVFGRRFWSHEWAHRLAWGSVGLSFLSTILVFADIVRSETPHEVVAYQWIFGGNLSINMAFLVDPLTCVMLLVVTGVGFLIHVYSVGYMHGEEGFTRFFTYMNLFMVSMLLLVMGNNYAVLFIGWEGVGLCSYLLIGYYYDKVSAAKAASKAFVVNRIGDAGFLLAIFLVFINFQTLDYTKVFAQVGHLSPEMATAIALCLLVGAVGKSAQIPLHTWLPDAMEGPTPVSALIHAATMVTAGVYLIARMHPLFERAPAAADVGAVIGCVTLFVAATIALTQTDLKRVIAYSTMSQIGYMVMGVSAGAYAAGLFHLMTHAFFKALLFMAAGSIIAAMAGVQNLDKMGGFRRAMPFTFAAMVIGGLALAGVPPFSGFFSKDEILLLVGERGGWHWILYVVGYLAAFLTAIYTFRMIFRAFYGDPVPEARGLEGGHLAHAETPVNPMTGEEEDTDVGFPGPGHFIAEREWPMRVAMGVLALGAIVLGFLQLPHVTHVVDHFLEPTFEGSEFATHEPSDGLLVLGLVLGEIGRAHV